MKTLFLISIAADVTALFLTGIAEEPDWRLLSMDIAPFEDGKSYCFYDAKNVQRFPSTVRTWMKCLAIADMNNIETLNKTLYETITPSIFKKLEGGYLPPLARLEKIVGPGSDQSDREKVARMVFQIMYFKAEANISDLVPIAPTAKAFSEVNCHERKIRILQHVFRGRIESKPENQIEWRYIEPGHRSPMFEMLCELKQ